MTDNAFDYEIIWKMYSPKPNPWFSSEIVYEGWGTASFEKPTGTIEGQTKIVVKEDGDLEVVMEYEQLNTDVTIYGIGNLRIAKFLQADLSEGNFVTIGFMNVNHCTSLKVKTSEGVFTSQGRVYYSQGFGLDNKLQFFVSIGSYEVENSAKPKYWVLPLINFVSTFHLNPHPLLAQHPLRLFSTPVVPEMEDENKRNVALFTANRANTLIDFQFDGKVGYIQPVLDYNERKEKLKSGQIKKLITALMISEITSKLDQVWFPYDYTNLISLAIGINVYAPWVEFRGENGRLMSRKHGIQHGSDYEQGYAVINEAVHGGLGHLISTACECPEFGKTYLRVLIVHLMRLQSYSRQIEDHMDLLCRTFDTLSEEFGLSVQNLSEYLPQDYQTKVSNILGDARREVEKLLKQSNSETQAVLQKIASRIVNAANSDRAFDLSVRDLLKKFDMPDLAIMDKYYAQYSETQGKSWVQILSKYRGAAIHTGYFSSEKYDVHDVVILEDHLQDILVRITLKIIGYRERYQPRVIPHLVEDTTVDWLSEETPATKLGYKAPIL